MALECYRCHAWPCICKDGQTIIHGDCRTVLASLPDGIVQCCVTSPPYWGLRDYGTATWEGGNAECDHVVGEIRTGLGMAALSEQYRGGGVKASEPKPMTAKGTCPKCGARRIDQQLGLESTPDEYVAGMVEVFREVRRVLRDDGTLWLNLGDSYATRHFADARGSSYPRNVTQGDKCWEGTALESRKTHIGKTVVHQTLGDWKLKSKDLVGIPWRVAFALQADGWYLRQDIIWHKPNPMPESVTDRCTKAHEYIFLMSKSARYRYDQEAVKEEASFPGQGGAAFGHVTHDQPGSRRISHEENMRIRGTTRNRRSVWTVTTKPYSGAHFAVFPPDLIEPCIKAGCPEGGTVLDPFHGSGTTSEVARKNGCKYVGIELNEKYIRLSLKRLRQGVLEFGNEAT